MVTPVPIAPDATLMTLEDGRIIPSTDAVRIFEKMTNAGGERFAQLPDGTVLRVLQISNQ